MEGCKYRERGTGRQQIQEGDPDKDYKSKKERERETHQREGRIDRQTDRAGSRGME